jgi:hypothetical protein
VTIPSTLLRDRCRGLQRSCLGLRFRARDCRDFSECVHVEEKSAFSNQAFVTS